MNIEQSWSHKPWCQTFARALPTLKYLLMCVLFVCSRPVKFSTSNLKEYCFISQWIIHFKYKIWACGISFGLDLTLYNQTLRGWIREEPRLSSLSKLRARFGWGSCPCVSRSEHQRLSDIFVQKGPYLKMYSTYIRQFDNNVALLDEQCRKNPGFAVVVKEFEVQVYFVVLCSIRFCSVVSSHQNISVCVCLFCLRQVLDVRAWLWSTTCWNRCRGSLSTSCCSQVPPPSAPSVCTQRVRCLLSHGTDLLAAWE